MGGEGSISNMISTLQSNKNLVGTRDHFFSRKRKFKELRAAYKRAEARLAAGPKATKEELQQIRLRIIEENKSRSKKIAFAMIGIAVISFIIFMAVFLNSH